MTQRVSKERSAENLQIAAATVRVSQRAPFLFSTCRAAFSTHGAHTAAMREAPYVVQQQRCVLQILLERERGREKNGAKKTLKVKTGGKVPRKIFKGASKAPIAGPLMAVALVV